MDNTIPEENKNKKKKLTYTTLRITNPRCEGISRSLRQIDRISNSPRPDPQVKEMPLKK